jgi:uncharacterized protein YjbJ (UPF0337 family)
MATPPQHPRGETNPPANPDPWTGQWEQLRPQLRSWWDRLTEADLGQIGGQKDRLVSLVQQRYGYTRDRAQQEVDRRLQAYGEQTAGIAATVTSAAQEVASRVTETAGTAAAKAQEVAGAAAATVADTAAGARASPPAIRLAERATHMGRWAGRHPLAVLILGAGVGALLGRRLWRAARPPAGAQRPQPAAHLADAGFLDATIQCVRCGQMVRQADMVSHATTCSAPGLPSEGRPRAEPQA